jgi:transcriptional regulator with XRE-family HTH domain
VAISPSSSVQRAREQLAERLRDIRLDARLTARALAAEAGWHEAKTSRIESAKQAPIFDDSRVNVELLSAQVTVTVPSEIVLYARAFERLSGIAVYGDDARARITDAIAVL